MGKVGGGEKKKTKRTPAPNEKTQRLQRPTYFSQVFHHLEDGSLDVLQCPKKPLPLSPLSPQL